MHRHRHIVAILGAITLNIGANYCLILAVDGNDGRHLRKQPLERRTLVDEHIAGGSAQKRLHSAHLSEIHSFHLVDVVVGGTHIETVVDVRGGSGTLVFRLESVESDSLRLGVWHVHKRGYTAHQCRTRLALDVGFVRQSRLAEVHLVVDGSRQNIVAGNINQLSCLSHKLRRRLACAHLAYHIAIDGNKAFFCHTFIN